MVSEEDKKIAMQKADAYGKKLLSLFVEHEKILVDQGAVESDRRDAEKRLKREEYRIKAEIADAVDPETGKAIYSNEAKRAAEFQLRIEKDELYCKYEKEHLELLKQTNELALANDIKSREVRSYGKIADLHIASMSLMETMKND